jgi:hypothetical protein
MLFEDEISFIIESLLTETSTFLVTISIFEGILFSSFKTEILGSTLITTYKKQN